MIFSQIDRFRLRAELEEANERLASQAATIERLRAVLAIYADERNWGGYWLGEGDDGWALAAAALGGSEGEQRNERD